MPRSTVRPRLPRMRPQRRFLALLWTTCIATVTLAATQWALQPQQSKLTFVGTQAGAAFEGEFERFTADIRFDPQDLAGSRFDVTIDLASVDSHDSERDELIRGPDLFAVRQHPTGRYIAERFTAQGGNKFSAVGKLTLRNVTRSVPIEFTFEKSERGAWLKGAATLDRLDFGIGQGEWQDTATVANEVKVRFALLLKQ